MRRNFWTLPVVICLAAAAVCAQSQRNIAGMIYFTNNTPADLRSFPIEVLRQNQRVRLGYPDDQSRFAFSNLRAGKYVLRLTWPKHCVLSYRLDLRQHSTDSIKVIMDAACAHANGKIQDLPAN
ncbi:MAG TPA: hypothetical protein VE961_02560 [Pyrinomonadaceae bacterium]|nr:hypothetical protein [Pyrinomonadaceae bacterium]